MISPIELLIIGLIIQCIILVRTVRKILKPKLLKVCTPPEPPRFKVRQFFIEKDKNWVWVVYDTKLNDFARSSGYFRTFSHEEDADELAKLYERTGGPI